MSFWFCLAFLVFEIVFRNLTFGWGPPRVDDSTPALVRFGVGFNVADNLFYHSLAQQGRSGLGRFSNIYTTTEHPRLLVSPLFLAVGRISRSLAIHPIAVLNLISLVAGVVFLVCLGEACRLLKFGQRTAFVVLCLALGGGGISWFRALVDRVGLGGILRIGTLEGPDLYFLDLYPAMAFTVYPFHSVSLGLVALVTMLLIRFDDPGRRFSWPQAVWLTLTALLLTGIRPYEPLVILICWGVTVLVSFAVGVSSEVKHRRLRILACLASGVVLPSAYNVWVSRQPIYVDWAGVALNLDRGANWGAAMLGLWILVAAGLLSLRRKALATPLLFLGVWSVFCSVILVVLSSGLTKLCGGCTIPLALVAGTVVERVGRRLPPGRVRNWVAAGLAGLALGSPVMVHDSLLRSGPPGLSSDFLKAVEAIRADSKAAVPTVLAGAEPGRLLPGLGGCRVFYGIDGLDAHYPRRRGLLTRLGFQPAEGKSFLEVEPAQVAATAREMLEQVKSGSFDYFLADQGDTVGIWLDPAAAGAEIYKGSRYRVVKITPAVLEALERSLQRIIDSKPG